MSRARLLRLLGYWPPYLGAGIRITRISDDIRSVDVEMKAHFWNRNYVGTHFGGSLYAMVDPFYMLILLENLGRDYIVWDKAATIRFKRPGQGRVRASFTIDAATIAAIRAAADADDKIEPKFTVQIRNDADEVVAEVDKVLSVRRKDKPRAPKQDSAALPT